MQSLTLQRLHYLSAKQSIKYKLKRGRWSILRRIPTQSVGTIKKDEKAK
jgi:hypothetical protein